VNRLELPEALRRLLACPDCDSEVELVKVEGIVIHVNIFHDDSCPWLRSIEARS
jgi:hypothetical protein